MSLPRIGTVCLYATLAVCAAGLVARVLHEKGYSVQAGHLGLAVIIALPLINGSILLYHRGPDLLRKALLKGTPAEQLLETWAVLIGLRTAHLIPDGGARVIASLQLRKSKVFCTRNQRLNTQHVPTELAREMRRDLADIFAPELGRPKATLLSRLPWLIPVSEQSHHKQIKALSALPEARRPE